MVAHPRIVVRRAVSADLEALGALARLSAGTLGRQHYSDRELAVAVEELAVIDPALIEDGTLYVAVSAGCIVGCGGWSRRAGRVAGSVGRQDLAPLVEEAGAKDVGAAASLRAFFIHPGYARRGIAGQLFRRCRDAAKLDGFRRMSVLASATAKPAYLHFGFSELGETVLRFADGVELVSYRMSLNLA